MSLSYEKCQNSTMENYPFFLQKLKQIQTLCARSTTKRVVYKLAGITWCDNIIQSIINDKIYPSEYFIKIVLNTCIINNQIVNPPIKIKKDKRSSFKYIQLRHNKLLILDALMKQGSMKIYENRDKYIYSEHSGALNLNNCTIDNVIVSAEIGRTDPSDSEIFLPINCPILAKHEFIFHTHPNATIYGGRLREGIVYEFPSSNDIFNFVKYHNEGKAQASMIIAPEGMYVIRPLKYMRYLDLDLTKFKEIAAYIIQIEKWALEKLKKYLTLLLTLTEDQFHKYISYNFKYINILNQFIKQFNLFIEYYPRIKKNGVWCLKEIPLQYIEPGSSYA